jgi:hypothetical protein
MKPKILLSLALVLSGAWAQPAVTNQFSDGDTLARIPVLPGVNSILFSPDGKTIATLRGNNTFWHKFDDSLTLQLWAVPSGALLWTASEPVYCGISFSPDSSLLLGRAGSGRVVFWSVVDGKEERSLTQSSFSVERTIFLPDGQTMAEAVNRYMRDEGEVRLWEAKTGRYIRTLKGQSNAICALAVSPDGKTLAAASDSGEFCKVSVLDVGTGLLRQTLPMQKEVFEVDSMAFSPNGETLAVGALVHDPGMTDITLWDLASGQLKRSLEAGKSSTDNSFYLRAFVAFSPDGETLVNVGANQTMKLWSAATGKLQGAVGEATPPQPGCFTVQFTQNGLLSAKVNPLDQVEVQFWNSNPRTVHTLINGNVYHPPPLTPDEMAALRAKADAIAKERDERALKFDLEQAETIETSRDPALQKLLNLDHAAGLLRMGERYRDGDGVPKDLAKARDYFEKAVAAGSPSAAEELSKLNPD